MANSNASFKTKTVSEALHQHFKDEKVQTCDVFEDIEVGDIKYLLCFPMKLKGMALDLVTELLRVFTKEALSRAAVQAKDEGDARVTIEHLEKILPQLLLDM